MLKNVDIARARLIIAGARPNPQFAMQYGFGDAYTKVIAGNTQQVGLNQLVETAGKRGARLRLAKENFELAQRQLDDLRFDVRCDVRKAYADTAAAEANVDLIENQRDVVERFVDLARKRVREGTAANGEEQQACLALDQFHALETYAYSKLRVACIRLDYLLGMEPDRDLNVDDNGLFRLAADRTELVPGPDMDIPSLEDLLKSAYANRPDLKVAEQQLVASKYSVSLNRRQQVPDVLFGSGFVFSTYNTQRQFPQQYGAYLNVNVDIPVFYNHQGEIAAARHSQVQSRTIIDQTKAQVKRDVYSAYEQLKAARSNIRLYQGHLLPDSKEVSLLAQKRYESGRSDIGDAIVGQQAYLNTMKAYFDTVVDYQNAWAELEKAIGAPVIF